MENSSFGIWCWFLVLSWSGIDLRNQSDHGLVQDRGSGVPVAYLTLRSTECPPLPTPGIPAMFLHCICEDMIDHCSYTLNLSICEI